MPDMDKCACGHWKLETSSRCKSCANSVKHSERGPDGRYTPAGDPDLVPDLLAANDALRAENKELRRKLEKRGRDEE